MLQIDVNIYIFHFDKRINTIHSAGLINQMHPSRRKNYSCKLQLEMKIYAFPLFIPNFLLCVLNKYILTTILRILTLTITFNKVYTVELG